jgi:hypothetical protein
LSVKDITKKAIFAKNSPANRWLQTIVREQIDAHSSNEQGPMETLYAFCRAEEELVRAFWLATLCRQSVSQAATEKEEKSYGKVSSEEIGMYPPARSDSHIVILDAHSNVDPFILMLTP